MTASTESRVIKQGRPGVIVLIALVVELVAILSLANQVVSKNLATYSRHHPLSFPGRAALAATTYRWQVSAQPGDRANELLAHLCLDLVVLALTGLLVYVLTRGPVTFLRAFFGTWLTVIVATMLGMIVLALVSPPQYPGGLKHVTGAVFLVPDGYGFVGGVVLGFVTALFAAIFAVATRRIIRISPGYDAAPAGGYRDDQPDWNDQTVAYPRGEYGGAPQPERTGYGYGDSGYGSGYGDSGYGSGYGGSAAGYAGAAAGGYYASQAGQSGGEQRPESESAQPAVQPEPAAEPAPDATQSIPRVEEPTQAMAPPTGAQPVAEQPAAAEPGTGQPSSEQQGAEDAPVEPSEAERPAAEPDVPATDPAATQQFPRPPDDEDLGQHPDHEDL